MNARIPTRRLGQSALAAFRPRSTYWIGPTRAFSTSPTRGAKPKDAEEPKDFKNIPDRDPNDPLSNPLLDEYLSRNEPDKKLERPLPQTGKMSTSSIFKPEVEIPGWRDGMTPQEEERLKSVERQRQEKIKKQREHDLHALRLDPAPKARRRFERRMVVRSLQKRGRLTKAEKIARTERQSLYRSPFLPTSVKKLTKIMNQIQGKTVEEALVQLRFSPKRVARDVLKGLQIARDEAIAARGMGLGAALGKDAAAKELLLRKKEQGKSLATLANEPYLADGTRTRPKNGAGLAIELKNGEKKVVNNLTEMYIDQAWVGRGAHSFSAEIRARGRMNKLTHRTTSFSVLLKEEKTRLRISDEIQKKRDNRKLWMPLPDRPVTSQRQYCLW